MNREQLIDALVCIGIDQVRQMETHQWLGVIRTLMNLVFSGMTDEELLAHYNDAMEKENDGPERPLAG